MSFWDFLAGNVQTEEEAEANIARQQNLLQEQTNRRLAAGEITQEQANANASFAANVGGAESVGGAYQSGFVEGLGDGLKNIGAGIGSAVKAVPWQVWAIGGAGVFLWIGGGAWLAKQTKGMLKP